MRQDLEQASVTPLELFFDLVFVFALTQVTAFMADQLNWQGILRGALVLMPSAGLDRVCMAGQCGQRRGRPIKLSILAGMAAMFILALCIPRLSTTHPADYVGLWCSPCAIWSSASCTS
jgi:low temperature requirement protein LtrA